MNALQQFVQACNGWLTVENLPALVKLDRLFPLLVRCGSCRFACSAQDAQHIMSALVAAGDYVRDVSFAIVDGQEPEDRAALWQPEPPAPLPYKVSFDDSPRSQPDRSRDVPEWDERDCSGTFDGHQVISDADPGL